MEEPIKITPKMKAMWALEEENPCFLVGHPSNKSNLFDYNPVKINKEELYYKYMQHVTKISEDCPEKTEFSPREIVEIISNILEENPQFIFKY